MIISFGDRTTEDIFNGLESKATRKYQKRILNVVIRKLDMINAAQVLKDLSSPPGNRLEPLKGDLKDYYSIRVNEQFRLIFIWSENGAHQVQLTDYHD